ncbi:MAG: hypothetical protein L0216_05830 [Planctomycetales bacterium]|nr:hypothetical protein [Planctomycetales bacterium]
MIPDSRWSRWIARAWPHLVEGRKLRVPRRLPHPTASGFRRTHLAEPVGQQKNWALALADGSRLHLHEFGDGRLTAHWDRIDPDAGLLRAVWHWLVESRSARLVLAATAASLLVPFLRS